MPDTSTASSFGDEDVTTVRGPFAIVRERLTPVRLGVAWAAVLVTYFAFVVPDDVAVFVVGSALALAFAGYAPLLCILTIGRLVSWLSGRLAG